MADDRANPTINRNDLRAAMRRAMHARWCGEPRSCGPRCECQPDPEELDAAVDAALHVFQNGSDPLTGGEG